MLRFLPGTPSSAVAISVLCALYLFAGLVGHDPWKSDDAINFGVVYGILKGGDWLVPRLVGEPFLDWPPLYYWLTAAGARLFAAFLPLHDAARFTSGLIAASFLGILTAASRNIHGRDVGTPATLICIGCLGLLVPIHDMQPLVALLAASAAFYAGAALLPVRPVWAGIWSGLGLGVGFLSAGLMTLLTLLPVALLLPLHRHWRGATSRYGFAVMTAVAAPLVAIWPAMLAWRSPGTLSAWWAGAVIELTHGDPQRFGDLAELLAWFAWPAWPLALWTLWISRQRWSEPAIFLPLIGSATALLVLSLFYQPRPLPALPLLVPLVLLAVPGAGRLRRGASNAFDWFAMMTFTLIAFLLWLGSIALTAGVPAQLARNLARLEPGFVPSANIVPFAIAAALSIFWLWMIVTDPRSPWRAATHWAAGATLMWLLLTILWLPWIDYGKSYRSVAYSLKQALPENAGCIAGRGLGGAQRASLEYFAGIVTVRARTRADASCRLLLEQSDVGKPPPRGWRKVWEGHRPGDRSERLRLYQRK